MQNTKILKVVSVLLALMLLTMTCFTACVPMATTNDGTAVTEGADATATDEEGEQSPYAGYLAMLVQVLPFVLIILAFYFFMIRPQKKQQKKEQEMRSSITVGDTVTTIGGITGTVRQIKDDEIFIIECGADKSKIAIRKWAIQSKDNVTEENA